MTGIYKIESKIHPDRCYIGSTIDIELRWHQHLYSLGKNNHPNPKLQHHYHKYGIEDLSFSIVEECDKELLIPREQHYLDTLEPYFNISPTAGSNLGYHYKLSEEVSENMRRLCRIRHEDDKKYSFNNPDDIRWKKKDNTPVVDITKRKKKNITIVVNVICKEKKLVVDKSWEKELKRRSKLEECPIQIDIYTNSYVMDKAKRVKI